MAVKAGGPDPVGNSKRKDVIAKCKANNVPNDTINNAIKKAAGSLLTKVDLFDVYTGTNIDENKKSLAYSLTFEDSKKTLTDEEINKEMEKIIEFLNKKLNAELRK